MATLSLKEVKKTFGAVSVIKGVDLDIRDREFVVFVGPSGCGKSTLLRMIAGLEDISEGDLIIDGDHANEVPPDQRGLAMVFQTYALYPHMTVKENMGFALKLAGIPQSQRDAKINEVAGLLQLAHLLDRKPKQLSGGQRQRVAIGRAMVRSPRIFLFDEPLSNLDAALRVQMRIELARLHDQLGATMIYVTHDQVEAMTLADKIVVLRDGRIEQVGAPMELYNNPANQFVAGFIGSPAMNFIPVAPQNAGPSGVDVTLPGGKMLTVPAKNRTRPAENLTLGIRPEHLSIGAEGLVEGEIMVVERLGGHTYVYVQIAREQLAIVETDGADSHRLHEKVRLSFNAGDCHLFDDQGLALERMNHTSISTH
ncbi:sn-glycerol-3-phosphate ABC transporter ATP-binding protein UgpC [Rhizobium sp. CBN3]|uniref:ABC transporter ATP-binding protein n=1 Tax=Rhizobium sp. CBN3 TaxID=3058045 RepID=UPI0026741136|nr:sn-glycerol-3-phosphate ABC transporter ATP-binding protein UgpC [Rhizobium sp. CBN3]MDO3434985.1 sn-glycerol-3-phosphate ABC transporter ATP-binding protein UgpC [Rhizobium sp. CBN3]